jgi:GH15 family glucan-1,4-alpha-glucosidase
METDTWRSRSVQNFSIDIRAIAQLIADTQLDSGEIPWCDGQKTDPWDHIEAAMGLSIGGFLEQARRAFEWFAGVQLEDGSCYSAYRQGLAEDKTR